MYKCARCGRILKHPKYKNGKAFGSICYKKLFGADVKLEDEDKDDSRPKIRGIIWN